MANSMVKFLLAGKPRIPLQLTQVVDCDDSSWVVMNRRLDRRPELEFLSGTPYSVYGSVVRSAIEMVK